MNWPPPTIPNDTLAERDVASADAPRTLGAIPPATWVGLLGGLLLLTAAVAVVASHWNTIGEGARVAGLVVGTAGLLAAAHRLRTDAPTTSAIIAHVGTFMTAAVGIAVCSLFGATWPTCITLGGAVLVGATAAQAGRWRSTTMHLGQVAGLALLATGVAALTGTTAGLVAMMLSIALLVMGAHRRSVSLAILAVFSPALAALAEAGIGTGSLERAGLVGEPLSWSGPMVGILAATVIGAIARDRRNDELMLVAATGPILGIVAGLASIDRPQVAWWSLPALILVAAELGLQLLPTDRLRDAVASVVDVIGATVAVGLWFSPFIVSVGVTGDGATYPWAIPVAATLVAVGLSTMRWHKHDSTVRDAGLAAAAAGATAIAVALGAGGLTVAAVALVATLGAILSSRRLSPVAIYGAAFWAMIAAIDARDDLSGNASIALPLALLCSLVGMVMLVRARLAADGGWVGWLEMTSAATAATLAVLAITPAHGAAVALATMATVAGVATFLEPRHGRWAIAVVVATGVMGLASATASGELDTSYMWGWVVVTVVFAILSVTRRSALMGAAASSAATITLATAVPRFDVSAVDFTVMAMLSVVALTGLVYTLGRRTPLDAVALTAGFLLLCTTTFDIDPLWASAAVVVAGTQLVVFGILLPRRSVTSAGIALAIGGVASSWFTSGLHGWFLDVIEVADITAADVWAAAMSSAALVAGLVVRRSLGLNSWFAYTGVLTLSGVWLVTAHMDRDPAWAAPLLLTIGIVATTAGAWRRLAAPLVGGVILTLIAVGLATGSDLTAVPTWLWLTIGGGVLLGTAVLIERTGRPGSPDRRTLMSRWG